MCKRVLKLGVSGGGILETRYRPYAANRSETERCAGSLARLRLAPYEDRVGKPALHGSVTDRSASQALAARFVLEFF